MLNVMVAYAVGICMGVLIVSFLKGCAENKEPEWNPPEEPPSDDRFILLSFENYSTPLVGHYEENEEGGNYYIGDDEESCIAQDLYVNGWMEVPMREERENERNSR